MTSSLTNCVVQLSVGVKKAVGTAASEPEKKDVIKHMAELWLREEV